MAPRTRQAAAAASANAAQAASAGGVTRARTRRAAATRATTRRANAGRANPGRTARSNARTEPLPTPPPPGTLPQSIAFGTTKNGVTMIVERKIKIVTEQHNIDKPPVNEGFPWKEWTVEIYILDQDGNEKPARCFTKAVYHLHPSFENPTQTFLEPPFKCTNEGWGEFEMMIDLYTTEKGGKQTIVHDLNFQAPQYENVHTVTFRNPSQALQAILRETGPLPTDEERKLKKGEAKNKRKNWDMDKIADALVKLGEDDLLHVIQMVHDHKDEHTYILNNVDQGEFSVDLYSLPENLLKMLSDFLINKGVLLA
ncbi:hypothetical protein VTJ04DRAFT_1168 [Mycothermus thermophilus]|uniref:uncharacterized protein n=1 Tax=Humicola insolens TaxID=85995 RepID=UPI003742AA90